MDTQQQSELEDIKKLINDRFDKQDEKINQIRIELAGLKVDVAWIKWLFGGLFELYSYFVELDYHCFVQVCYLTQQPLNLLRDRLTISLRCDR